MGSLSSLLKLTVATSAMFFSYAAPAVAEEPVASSKIQLADYEAPHYRVTTVWLDFELGLDTTIVTNRMTILRDSEDQPLKLDGEELELLSISLNGIELSEEEFELTEEGLTLLAWPEEDSFELEIRTKIHPRDNLELSGLYTSGDTLVTQCESRGFRRITYFVDRPDVQATYTTVIHADKELFPFVMANGNEIMREESEGIVTAAFEDPFPKPSYLFALVAGDFDRVTDSFTTMSGCEVELEIFGNKGDGSRLLFAMDALKKAMAWDEENFGREFDLKNLRVVGVSDFNAGAMENKGLLIFNNEDLVADKETTTDAGFERVFTVVGHEYFHNWTGNRITIRDWFQLTLKEGFTTFREQEFTASHTSPTLKRIDDVDLLRNAQFPESHGPTALPLVPDEISSFDNLYTCTTYEKGAEIYRMLRWIVGPEAFREGCDLYFDRYDGSSAEAENFVDVMEEVTGCDLTLFRKWYHVAETPTLSITWNYDRSKKEATLTVEQGEEPLHLPLAIGMVSRRGEVITMEMDGAEPADELVLDITEPSQTFHFRNLKNWPVLSCNRDFSAVAHIAFEQGPTELFVLLGSDPNLFNRYDASQQLYSIQLHRQLRQQAMGVEQNVLRFMHKTPALALQMAEEHPEIAAACLSLPGAEELLAEMVQYDVKGVVSARRHLAEAFGKAFKREFHPLYVRLSEAEEGELTPDAIGRRSLKNTALHYLCLADPEEYTPLLKEQYDSALVMTDRMAALALLCRGESVERDEALADFYERFKEYPDVVNQWLRLQAGTSRDGVLETVKALESHEAFDIRNPNKVRALIGSFGRNLEQFHAEDGSGYAYIADKIIEIDGFNRYISAGLASLFEAYPKLLPEAKRLMGRELERIVACEELSQGTREIIEMILGS